MSTESKGKQRDISSLSERGKDRQFPLRDRQFPSDKGGKDRQFPPDKGGKGGYIPYNI